MQKDRNNIAELVRSAYEFNVEDSLDLSCLDGKTILITGGASGFGEGFFRKWAEHNANVIIGDVNAIKGKALVEEVRAQTNNQNLHFLYCDVTKWQSQVDFFRDAAKLSPHAGIDAVVANAGIASDNPVFDNPAHDLGALSEPLSIDLKVVEVNLIGAMYTAHLAFHYLPLNPCPPHTSPGQDAPKRDRHLLLIGSVAGIAAFPGQVEYCVAKHGVTGLYRSLMCTAFTKGIRVNLIMPYFSDTPMLSTALRAILAGTPVGKVDSIVDAGTRLMGSGVSGKALVVGPDVKVDKSWTVLSDPSKDGKSVAIREVYGQDFDAVDAFTLRYVKLMYQITILNGWRMWVCDMVAALLHPFQAFWKRN
ncbi:hypothetical protein EAE99_006899 [Botrytis elliptica]|nr:hypothetical protein EAE99_006899 [Botrytis elliptica]